MGILDKFKSGFRKSATNFAAGLKEIIIKKEIDDKTLNEIEEFLISSDVGIDAASEIKDITQIFKVGINEKVVTKYILRNVMKINQFIILE